LDHLDLLENVEREAKLDLLDELAPLVRSVLPEHVVNKDQEVQQALQVPKDKKAQEVQKVNQHHKQNKD